MTVINMSIKAIRVKENLLILAETCKTIAILTITVTRHIYLFIYVCLSVVHVQMYKVVNRQKHGKNSERKAPM